MLLCGTHHDVVDVQPNTYAVADLSRWKAEHEKWVYDSLVEAVTQVQFTELEMVTKTLLRVPGQSAATFTVTAPLEKMRRNGLTEQIGLLLAMGLANAHVVEKFVASFAAVDPNFPEALKGGFVHEYNLLVEAGTQGDTLFESLRDFADGGSRVFSRQAASLCVLAYLFEKCEVFES